MLHSGRLAGARSSVDIGQSALNEMTTEDNVYRTVEIDVVTGAEDMVLELDSIDNIRSAAVVSSAGPTGHPVVQIIGTPEALELVLVQHGYESDVDLYATDKVPTESWLWRNPG